MFCIYGSGGMGVSFEYTALLSTLFSGCGRFSVGLVNLISVVLR